MMIKLRLFLLAVIFPLLNFAADKDPVVFTFELKEEINEVALEIVKNGLEAADSARADFVVIEMNTYGGAVDVADQIGELIMKYEKPVYVWININAGSAGSYISVACDSIYMSEGAIIGASTVVDQNGEVVPEKYQSFMRSKFRTAAESTGKDPILCQKFVGEYLGTDSANVMCLTTQEAIDTGICISQVRRVEDIFIDKGMEDFEVKVYNQTAEEVVIGFFLNPVVKSILVLLIIGGIYYEFKTPGVGFPLAAAVAGAVLYFVPDYLDGALAYWELILFLVGLVLVALEVFVIPGFGIAGISGIACLLLAMVFSMLQNDIFDFHYVRPVEMLGASWVMAIGLAGFLSSLLMFGTILKNSKRAREMTVQANIESQVHHTDGAELELGALAVVSGSLRPQGTIRVGVDDYDAKSRGPLIEVGTQVRVIDKKGYIYWVEVV